MDVGLKSSLEQLLAISESIETRQHMLNGKTGFRNVVIEDIFSFINRISLANAAERIEYFNDVYLAKELLSLEGINIDKTFPESLKTFCEIDKKAGPQNPVCTSTILLSFLTLLGKHYRFSKFDKKDISTNDFIDYINSIQRYISSYINTTTVSDSENKSAVTETTTVLSEVPSDSENELVEEPEESLEDLLQQLNSLIGLDSVKQEVNSLINMLKIKKIREERGFITADVSKHLVFLGNPGTGKTTVARLLSRIYKHLGVLEKGQLVEVDRVGLVAGYVGQTALKTKEKIDEAMGGILFIDEAYTLAKGGNDFGQEAIDTILKAMEDYRDKFVVIVAGYPEPMNQFLQSNPGLKSRFNKNITFEDYSEEELFSILESSCSKYALNLTADAKEKIMEYLNSLCKNKPSNFANGREMRNLFEKIYENQANRLATSAATLTDEAICELTIDDLPEEIGLRQSM